MLNYSTSVLRKRGGRENQNGENIFSVLVCAVKRTLDSSAAEGVLFSIFTFWKYASSNCDNFSRCSGSSYYDDGPFDAEKGDCGVCVREDSELNTYVTKAIKPLSMREGFYDEQI